MRTARTEALPLVYQPSNHEHARELKVMSQLLEQMPEILDWVHADLTRGLRADRGRHGMSAEQVLRALIIKQMNGMSYENLAFHLSDSMSYRAFCRIGIAQTPPSASALQRDIKRLRAETLEAINRTMVRKAVDAGVERGRQVRTDSTPIESNIHHPTDSSLLWDCVRVMTTKLMKISESVALEFSDHRRRAKKRHVAINNVRSRKKRIELYKDLLMVTGKVVRYVEKAQEKLQSLHQAKGTSIGLEPYVISQELEQLLELARKVIDQTQRRVLNGEQVPAADKVVSIFEPHTDILVKEGRDTVFGHKAGITTGTSGMILDLFILEGNWSDATVAVDAIKRLEDILPRTPKQAVFDGAFASKANFAAIKEQGVSDVVFSKSKGIEVSDMAQSTWVYRKLLKFRAGVEAGISFLKRAFGLDRCNWSGFDSFQSYAMASAVSANLLIFARHLL